MRKEQKKDDNFFRQFFDTRETPILQSLTLFRKIVKDLGLLPQRFWLPNPLSIHMEVIYEKMIKYCLNLEHEEGSSKALLFTRYLGLNNQPTQENVDEINK